MMESKTPFTIDWSVWRIRPALTIEEALLLCLGVEPKEACRLDSYMEQESSTDPTDPRTTLIRAKGDYARSHLSEYNALAESAERALVDVDGNRFISGRDTRPLNLRRDGFIHASDFAEWWQSIGRKLPDSFPNGAFVKPDNAPVGSTTVTLESSTEVEPAIIKGKPESLKCWMEWVITQERGLSMSDEMPYRLQRELIDRVETKGIYKDDSAVKRAWRSLKLKSAKK